MAAVGGAVCHTMAHSLVVLQVGCSGLCPRGAGWQIGQETIGGSEERWKPCQSEHVRRHVDTRIAFKCIAASA